MNKAERQFLVEQVQEIPRDGVVVEIGSWTGGSASVMAKEMKYLRFKYPITCIDTWDYRPKKNHPALVKKAEGRNIFKEFRKKMKSYPHSVMKGKNADQLKYFNDRSINLLFIDGDHSYEGVMDDICNWFPKMRVGGIMCGHDYGREMYGVTKAVTEIFKDRVENPARSMWRVVI